MTRLPHFFGGLIKTVREKKNMTQKDLCNTLCNVNQLSKIERGISEADYFLLSALLERLGISLDKFELILEVREYEILQIREKIEQELIKRNYLEVRCLLQEYRSLDNINLILKEQYIQKINAIILVEEDGNFECGISLLKEAISATIKISYDSHSIISFLSLEEMRLLLLLAAFYYESGNLDYAKELLQKLLVFVENGTIDKENSIKVYPGILYYLGRIASLKREEQVANEFCVKGIYFLTNNGRTYWLSPLLQLQIEIREREEKCDSCLNQKKRKLQALEELEKEFSGKDFFFYPLYQTMITHEIYLNVEVMRGTRIARNLSQKKASEEICNVSSLVRMETKKRRPSWRILREFSSKLGMKGIRLYSPIETMEIELLEKRWELDKLLASNQIADARMLYFDLKIRLERESSVLNRQYLLFVDTLLLYQEKEISQEKALSCYEKAYFLTSIEKNYLKEIREPLTKQEGYILNQIVRFYKEKGDYDSALKVTKNVLNSYREGSVQIKYYYKLFSILVMKLAGIFEECGNYKEAKKLYKEGIAVALKNARGNLLAKYLAEYCYTMEQEMGEKKNEDKEKACKKYFLQAFTLSELFHDKNLSEIIQKHLKMKLDIMD